jgi:hypothetical protein
MSQKLNTAIAVIGIDIGPSHPAKDKFGPGRQRDIFSGVGSKESDGSVVANAA